MANSGRPDNSGSTPPRVQAFPRAVDRLITEFAMLPGIGRRSAERMAFHILKSPEQEALSLAQAISDVKKTVRHCHMCSNLTDSVPGQLPFCAICEDPRRDRGLILVVEQPKDLIALELTGMYKGLYHVLMGRLSPMDEITPSELTISQLLARVRDPSKNPASHPIREIILGLNPTVEGDGTALYLAEQIAPLNVKVTRLARGLPTGSNLEFANKSVLADAICGRQSME